VTDPTTASRDQELLERLDDATARLLFPERFPEPLRVTLEYPAPSEALAEAAADALSRAGEQSTDAETGRVRAAFGLEEVGALHELFTLLEADFPSADVDVRINGKDLPLTRELWLPLFWSLQS
jgi:hypothetical protein